MGFLFGPSNDPFLEGKVQFAARQLCNPSWSPRRANPHPRQWKIQNCRKLFQNKLPYLGMSILHLWSYHLRTFVGDTVIDPHLWENCLKSPLSNKEAPTSKRLWHRSCKRAYPRWGSGEPQSLGHHRSLLEDFVGVTKGLASKKSTPFSGALEHWILGVLLGHAFLIGGHVACGRKMYTIRHCWYRCLARMDSRKFPTSPWSSVR